MIKFIFKGLIRDKTRSLFPILVCMCGVFIVFVGATVMTGMLQDLLDNNAKFDTGHVKIVSYKYSKEISSRPIELSLETDKSFFDKLKKNYPEYRWTRRTVFGGLLDIPDENNETRVQAPVIIMGIDFLSKNSIESKTLKVKRAIKKGGQITSKGQILMSKKLAEKLKVNIGDKATVLCTTVDGGNTSENYTICGFIKFGIGSFDKRTIVMDTSDSDYLLDMSDYSAEILGYMKKGLNIKHLEKTKNEFNANNKSKDEFRPYMLTVLDQNNLRKLYKTTSIVIFVMLCIFIFLMTLVLWNAGLISGIRRYSEVGIRLAIGERRGHIVISMLIESILTGIAGTILGLIFALPLAYYFQEVGLDYSDLLSDVSVIMSGVMKAKITYHSFLFATLPGIFSSFLGMAMACIGIYKRETASLFKELET